MFFGWTTTLLLTTLPRFQVCTASRSLLSASLSTTTRNQFCSPFFSHNIQSSQLQFQLQMSSTSIPIANNVNDANKKRHHSNSNRNHNSSSNNNKSNNGQSSQVNVAMDVVIENNTSKVASLNATTTATGAAKATPPTSTDNSEFERLHISALTKQAIREKFQYEKMTEVQRLSIPVTLQGKDAVVKARTGTGKTIAFLVPAIESLLQARQQGTSLKGKKPIVLVLSPTRELAQQISDEAATLCTFHGFSVVTMVGGTNIKADERAIRQPNGLDIVVATPGRLLQHLTDTTGFASLCASTQVLIFDEADRLLDMGFKRDIDRIMGFLPTRNQRQTLLFSATFSTEVKEIASAVLRPGYDLIDTVGEQVEQTHSHVPQTIIVTPLDDQVKLLAHLIAQQSSLPQHKVIVFFPTARQTGCLAELFTKAGVNILEIHSRKSQSARTKASDDFRNANSAIMFSSDVTARGMDYPDISLVIQVGLTSRDQYIHRLGRTARAGKEGNGVIICFEEEEPVLRKELGDLPLVTRTLHDFIQNSTNNNGNNNNNNNNLKLNEFTTKITDLITDEINNNSNDDEMYERASQAWAAWLGFYKGYAGKLKWSSKQLVEKSAQFGLTIGLPGVPGLPRKTLGKMGLMNVEGLPMLSNDHEAHQRPKSGNNSNNNNNRNSNNGGGGGNNAVKQQQQPQQPRQQQPPRQQQQQQQQSQEQQPPRQQQQQQRQPRPQQQQQQSQQQQNQPRQQQQSQQQPRQQQSQQQQQQQGQQFEQQKLSHVFQKLNQSIDLSNNNNNNNNNPNRKRKLNKPQGGNGSSAVDA